MKPPFTFVFDYGFAGPLYRVFHKRHLPGRPAYFGAVWRKGSRWVAQGNGIMPDSKRFRTRVQAAQHMAEAWYV